jgi:hypothetical protein
MFADLNRRGTSPSSLLLRCREFLSAFAGIDMPERDAPPEILEVPEQRTDEPNWSQVPAELINNGDTFNIMRLDGLDPMIAWAMGAATGHTAVALWRDNSLMVTSSAPFPFLTRSVSPTPSPPTGRSTESSARPTRPGWR